MNVMNCQIKPLLLYKERLWLFAGFCLVLIATSAYCYLVGPIIFMNDAYIYADRAKHLALKGNLDLTPEVIWFYPPLYSIFLSVAYKFSDPDVISKIISGINILLYASAFFPISLILKSYSQIRNPFSRTTVGILLTLAPTTLPYSAMVLSEVLFFPIFLWFFYFFTLSLKERAFKNFILSGIMLALGLLTRDASMVVLISFIVIAIADIILSKHKDYPWKSILVKYIIAIACFMFIFYGWKIYENFFTTYPTYFKYPLAFDLIEVRLSWLFNLLFYYLTAPLSMASIFSVLLIVCHPKDIVEDLIILFPVLCVTGAIIAAAFTIQTSWGGAELTHNRYLVPYMILPFFIALRYVHYFDRSFFKILCVTLILLVFANIPFRLHVHFTDALALFISSVNYFKLPSVILNMAFSMCVIIPPAIYLSKKARSTEIAVALIFLIFVVSDMVNIKLWRNQGLLNFQNAQKLGQPIYSKIILEPNKKVFYDPDRSDFVKFADINRVLYYLPFLVEPKTIEQLSFLKSESSETFLYISNKVFLTFSKLTANADNPNLYKLGKDSLSYYVLLDGFYGFENYNNLYTVSWLKPLSKILINSNSSVNCRIQLSLATEGKHRLVEFKVNGIPIGPKHLIDKVLWVDGYKTVSWNFQVLPGKTILELTTSSDTGRLPGGREVSFLMIGAPVINQIKIE